MIKRIFTNWICIVLGAILLAGSWYAFDAGAVNSATTWWQRFGIMPISGGNGTGATIGQASTATALRASVAIGDFHIVTILSTIDCYVRQGASTATVTSANGAFLKKNVYVPVLVTYGMDYVAQLSANAGSETGTLYIWHHESGTGD